MWIFTSIHENVWGLLLGYISVLTCLALERCCFILSPRWSQYTNQNPGVFQFSIKSWRPRQSGRHFPEDTFKRIFLNENVWISIKISLNCVPRGPINNIPALVQTMAWHRPGDKPLSEPMMVCLLTHICVTRPQWVKCFLKDTYQCLHDNIWMLHGEADLYSEIYWIRL